MRYTKENKENGVEVRTYKDGTKEWRLGGRLHRADGPAIERADGKRAWYINGRRHRTDGPAVVWADGTEKWYLNGHPVEKRVVMDELFAARVAAMWAPSCYDPGESHAEEDKLMLEAIRAAGYVKTAEAIEKSWRDNEHWYA